MRRVLSMLKILAAVYLLLMLLVYALQRRLLYLPTPAPGAVAAEEVRFETAAGGLRGWVLRPGAERAVLYYGGNAEAVEYNLPLFREALPQHAVYLLPYRGYSGNPGRPSEDGLVADALAVYDQLRERHESISVIGRSLGSGVAVQLASQRPVARLALVTPFDSIARVAQRQLPLLPAALLMRDKYESWRLAPELGMPVLVLQAGNDRVIAARHTEALVAVLSEERLQHQRVEAAGHNDIQDYPAYRAALTAFFAAADPPAPTR